jgi:hypothetical protein
MTQTLYANMNKNKQKTRRLDKEILVDQKATQRLEEWLKW